MKRQVQEPGVRKWDGGSLISLQSEVFKVLDDFFGACAPCILSGLTVTPSGDKYEIEGGLVVLCGLDPQGNPTVKVAPFTALSGVTLPVYLTLAHDTQEMIYADGRSKAVAHLYKAVASNIEPAQGDYLTVTAEGGTRFVDALQDAEHRFITAEERTRWDVKTNPDGIYPDMTVGNAQKINGVSIRMQDGALQWSADGVTWRTIADSANTHWD